MILVELTRDPVEIGGPTRPVSLNPLTITGMAPLKEKGTIVHVVNAPVLNVREGYEEARNQWEQALHCFARPVGAL